MPDGSVGSRPESSQARQKDFPSFRRNGGHCQSLPDQLVTCQAMPKQGFNEIQILFAAGDEFLHGEVVDFQAKTNSSPGIFILDRNEAILPSQRQHGGLLADTVGIVTEGLVKRGALTDAAINQVRILRAAQGE